METLVHSTDLINLPLSSNQKRLWVIYQLDKCNPSYNIGLMYHIEGGINLDTFRKSMVILFERHHTMFSVFKQKNGVPYISIIPGPVEVELIDFSATRNKSAREEIELFASHLLRKCFDIEAGPLYRLYLLKESSNSHFFCGTIHHLIFDGFSRRIFVEELSKIYSGLIKSKFELFEPLRYFSYDYAEYKKNELSPSEEKELIDFWKENLKDCQPALKFPFDFPRTGGTSGYGCREQFTIPEEYVTKLKLLSKEEDSTIFNTMLALLGALLKKYTGENDICIGIPVSDRRSFNSMKLFGLFVNTVVVRLKIGEGKNLRDLIRYTRDTLKSVISHSKLPFEKVIEIVNPERSPGLHPFFQISLSWINNLTNPMDLGGISGKRITVKNGVSPSDITFYMWESGNCIEGEIEYSTDLLKSDTIIRLRDNFLIMIEKSLININVNIDALSIISAEETDMILSINNTKTEYPKEKTIAQRFDDQVSLYPDKEAIVFKGERLTYIQLSKKAGQLAHSLMGMGVVRNTPVALMAEKSLEMIVGMIGILKAGGAYVPIDPEYPEERMNFIMKDSGCKILVTQDRFMNKNIEGKKITINASGLLPNQVSDNSSSDLAYIMYTSGTTGIPKGTQIPQLGVINLVCNTNHINFAPSDRVLQSGTIVFDASTIEIWGALLNGATLFIIEKDDILNTGILGEILSKDEITVFVITSSLFTQIAEVRTDIFYKLKYLLIGGDVLSVRHINKVRRENPQLIVINGYGPTENSCMSAFYRIERDFDRNIPIGKPVSNTTVYIFDRYMNYQPVGVVGELYVGGVGLSKGYLNRDDLNRTSFVDHPFIPGKRLYKTGDYARWLSDGNIEFHGRIDNQLKIRGFRVELEEIESVILQIDDVIETVVKPVRITEGDYRLIAFLNVPESFILDSSEIASRLREKLPSYMVPTIFKLMHGFPITVNGKIDKKILVFDQMELEVKESEVVKYCTNTQKIIYNIWSEALKTNDISGSENFFEIGGSSLLAIRVINRINEHLGISLTFKELNTNPTVFLCAGYIDNHFTGVNKVTGLTHLTQTENLPLTRNQKRLWLISAANPEIASYIIGFTIKLTGKLNREIFQESLEILFNRHHIIFSVIKTINGEPFFDIKPAKIELAYTDKSEKEGDDEEKRGSVIEMVLNESRKPFDLEKGLLYRIYLIKTASDEYYFHLSIHHIIFDGWSWSVLVNDLNEIYNSLLKGEKLDLKKILFQQYDYAQWEENNQNTEVENKQTIFWKENLKGSSTMLNFPYDYQRMDQASGRGRYEPIRISKELSEKLRKISKDENSSLYATLMCAFGILLHKFTGDVDLNVGLPIAFRPHSTLENICGMFVNTVVVRLRYSKELTFRDLIHIASEASLDAIANQDLAYEKVVEVVKPTRIANINPLFQVAFAWQNNLDKPLNLDGIKIERLIVKERTIPFDFLLSLWETGSCIEGEIGYSIDLLKDDTILTLKENFLNLLNSLVENPDIGIESISMISARELKMIETINNTFVNFSRDKTIIRLFEERVNLDPEKMAIISDSEELTYSELDLKVNRLAAVLQTYNIGTGDFVGILLRRSPELIICLLALFKTGAAYIPLNLTDPDNRIISIIDAANIKFVITNDKHELDLKEDCKRLEIEQLLSQAYKITATAKIVKLNSSDPAYIIFTSGTTGTPKGVLVNHKSVINLIEWVNLTFKISNKDKLLWITNLSFDLSVYDIFGILAAGGIIRILNDEDRQDPDKQYELLLNEGITFWDSAPQSLLQLTSFFNRNRSARLYDSLRLVFLSGDWIPLSLPTSVKAIFQNAMVIGLGGATEATIWSNYFIIDEINPAWKSIPYGKPIQNSGYYILDDQMHHCRIKQPGNLYIGGECLAVGYYNDPILTESKFKSDPFSPGSKLYLTGDKAQWMADGNIEFLGRDDEQIKVRGYRLEIGEIKNVVLRNKVIREALVIPDKSDRYNIKVILFITTYDNEKLDIRDLKGELRQSLPEYMIPAEIIHYTEFPVTANGKIDTKKLLSNYLSLLADNQLMTQESETIEELENLTPTQMIIHEIWCEMLKKVRISVSDNFFDIGGNSLLALRLINNIKEQIGAKLSFKEIISCPTILQSGNFIDNKRAENNKLISLVHLTRKENLPLTRNQKRLWLISKFHPSLPSYIIGFTYKLVGPLNRDIFQKSIEVLFRRHHIVFTVIKEVKGEPFCDIVPSGVGISFSDFSGFSENEKEHKVKEIIHSDSEIAFDLNNGPLYRLYLMMISNGEFYFHLSIHHIIFDGWSWSVLVNDLDEIYSSLLKGKSIELEEIEFQQYDYAHWEESNRNSKLENELVDFWKENLKGASPRLNFPYDYQYNEKSSGRGSNVQISIPPDLSQKLRELTKAEGSSLFTTMMSVFGIQMSKYSGEDDINIGLPLAYRPHSKLENIFGMFVNTVVVRLRYAKESTFRDIIQRTNEAALNAIANQDLPFETVVEIVNPERITNVNPLFQVAFVWQNNLLLPLRLEDIRSAKVTRSEGTSPFDILLSLWENGDRIEGEIGYSSDLLKYETILRFKNNFLVLIKNLVENSGSPVESLPVISMEEKLMIERFNSTSTDYPKDKTITGLFGDQVKLYPDKKAVVFNECSLTYRELNNKANQLARTLMEAGVKDNTPVGLLAEKSLDMIVGIIGILKCGGAYVPIDPEFPHQRINFIQKDSECKILLVQDKFMNIGAEEVPRLNLNSASSYHIDTCDFEISNKSSDLAYIMYTSGTTGVPKGSMILQYSVIRLVCNTNYIELTPDDRILLTGAIVFDATTFEIWGALLNGGTLYLADKETILNPRTLREALWNNNISILWLTSALFTQIADARTDIFGKLRYLLVGGDVLSTVHINKVRKNNPKLKIINGYGPTENTTFSTTYLIEKDFKKNIPIGKPISNSTAYILDNNLNYQPLGVVGELYVGGEGLSKGYINREALNNSCFINHPFKPGERIYRTGDYGKWLPDGNIEFHGRIDNQLKIRGFRVELEGIESTISQIEGVVETVIKPIKVKQGDYKLIAFLNVQESFKSDPKEINSQISTKLPSYMLPSAYRFMNGFPKTINGKTDRKALCFNVLDLNSSVREDVNTLTPTERIIYDIFCEILKTGEISKYDNFFEIGGNSLLAISVFSKIEAAFDIELGLRVFFDSPRIGDLAEAINIHLQKKAKGNQPEKGMSEMSNIIEGEI